MDTYISKSNYINSFTKDHKPVATCKSGDTIVFQTEDAFSGFLTDESQTLSTLNIEKFNPATGPVYISDAKPGDILRVDIKSIELADHGFMHASPSFGTMARSFPHEQAKKIPIVNGVALFNSKISIPIDPMVGVIGTAPSDGEISTDHPGTYGGNMDCKEIKSGASIFLPVNVEGALLSMGDIHALQGDGEVLICGLEISGEITVSVAVIKNKTFPLPMIVNESEDKIYHIYSDLDLDVAAKEAVNMTHRFLVDLGMDVFEAGMLLSLIGNVSICQIVDPEVTARMDVPLSIAKKYGFNI